MWLNQNGYRSQVNQHTWEKSLESSVVAIGCSQMLGDGLNWEDSLSGIIEREMNFQVVNLAMAGTGVEYAWQQVMRILELEVRPAAFIINWSDPTRWIDFVTNTHHLPVAKKPRQATHYDEWLIEKPSWACYRALEIIRSTHLMVGNIPLIDFTWNWHYNDKRFLKGPHHITQVDYASPKNLHWGKQTNLNAYDYVRNQINKLNIRPNFR